MLTLPRIQIAAVFCTGIPVVAVRVVSDMPIGNGACGGRCRGIAKAVVIDIGVPGQAVRGGVAIDDVIAVVVDVITPFFCAGVDVVVVVIAVTADRHSTSRCCARPHLSRSDAIDVQIGIHVEGERAVVDPVVDDLVALTRAALEDGRYEGPLNAVSPEPVRNAEFTRTLAATVKRPAFFAVPAFALRAALGELSGELLGSRRALPARALELGFAFSNPKLEAALELVAHVFAVFACVQLKVGRKREDGSAGGTDVQLRPDRLAL